MNAIAVALSLSILPVNEAAILNRCAQRYELNAEQTALLFTIRRVENGSDGKEMGVETPRAQRYKHNKCRSLMLQGYYASGSIKKHYNGDLDLFAARWCPLNKAVWLKNAKWFMGKFGHEK